MTGRYATKEERGAKIAIESLVAFGLATFVLLIVSVYANKHRAEEHTKRPQHQDE